MAMHWFRSILCVIVAGAAIWGSFVANLPERHTATTLLVFEDPYVIITCGADAGVAYAYEPADIWECAGSLLTPAENALLETVGASTRDGAIWQTVSITPSKKGRLTRFTIAASHPRPEVAGLLANRYAQAVVEYRLRIARARRDTHIAWFEEYLRGESGTFGRYAEARVREQIIPFVSTRSPSKAWAFARSDAL